MGFAAGRALSVLDANAREIDRVVPDTVVWLEGLRPSATQVGARGYRYPAYEQTEPPSTVDAFTLVLYVSGHASIRRTMLAREERYEVGPGDLSLHPASVPAQWAWNRPLDVLHVYIDPTYLRDIVIDERGWCGALTMRSSLRIHDEVLTALGVELIEELAAPEQLASLRSAKAVGERLAIHLLRHHFSIEARGKAARTLSAHQTARLREMIETGLDGEISVAMMARAVGLGTAHFSRVFRDTFGRTPHDYVREHRLARAHDLLVASSMSVAEIASATGFSDQSHLTRCFAQRFGVPPARLRKRERPLPSAAIGPHCARVLT